MVRVLVKMGVAAAAVMLVSGCSAESDPSPGEVASETSTPSEADPEHEHQHVGEDEAVPGAGGAPDQVAADALRAWSQPQLSAEQWWAGFEPFLNASGREAYSWTDPSTIPALKVGVARVRSMQAETYAVVEVATDRGPVQVMLTRPTVVSGWLVDRFDLSAVDLSARESSR